jgi:hypothetical protein
MTDLFTGEDGPQGVDHCNTQGLVYAGTFLPASLVFEVVTFVYVAVVIVLEKSW